MRTMNFRSLIFNYSGIKINCIYCDKVNTDYTGWESLCNRACYYSLVELLDKYNEKDESKPDPKIIKYFTKHPEPTHSFSSEKILMYIKNKK